MRSTRTRRSWLLLVGGLLELSTGCVVALFAVGAYATRLIRGGRRADRGRYSAVGWEATRLRRHRLLGLGVRRSKSLDVAGL